MPYSEKDKVYGYEAFARGKCNYCGHESDPSQCEFCAQAPDIHKMGDLSSVISKEIMGWREMDREFLKIGRYREYLKEYYATIPLRPYLRDFITATLEHEDLDWPIDRPGECGIDVEIDGHSNTIHTWFSGIAGYLAAFTEYAHSKGKPGMVKDFWYSPETRIVHFMGFDCSFSHAIVYPSLLHNCDGMTRNVNFFPNKFLKLEGEDFSTSRGIAIWVNDILKEAPLDAVRFYLALHSPEEETSNFERSSFNRWMADFFLPAVERVRSAVSGQAIEFDDRHLLSEDRDFLYRLLSEWNNYSSMKQFSIKGIARTLNTFLGYLNDIPSGEKYRLGMLASIYAVTGMCVHPDLSGQLKNELSIDVEKIMTWIGGTMEILPV